MAGEAGKGSGRGAGRDDKKFREGYSEIDNFDHSKDITEKFEEKFMGKIASEEEAVSGKYFME